MNNLSLFSETSSGFTSVSDIFIDKYVPSANGEFVKVYLYLLRMLSDRHSDLSVSSLADTFNQTENDVMRALRYWDKLGILALSYDANQSLSGITVKELKNAPDNTPDDHFGKNSSISSTSADIHDNYESERNLGKVLSMNVNMNAKKLKELSSNKEFSMLLYAIEQYLGKPLSKSEAERIVYYYDTLHFPSDLIEYLITYCVSKGKTDFRYVEKIALSWADAGINTVEAAKDEVSNHSEAVYMVMKAFGLSNREPGKLEKDMITKWSDTFCFDTEMIIEACNRTMKATHQPSFEYADSILSRWYNTNIKTFDDVKKADAAFEASKASSQAKNSNVIRQGSNRFNNFSQYPKKSEDFYDKLLSNNN